MEHITKLGAMLVKHKQESYNWKGSIGPKIEEKMTHNIVKGEGVSDHSIHERDFWGLY